MLPVEVALITFISLNKPTATTGCVQLAELGVAAPQSKCSMVTGYRLDSKALTQTHTEGPAILAPCKIGAQIHVIFAAQHEAGTNATARKNIVRIEL